MTIPCTVAILTKNSAATLPRALESVRGFAEVLVSDGGSTDATLDIAREHGARILSQSPSFLGADGRIRDYGGVRNEQLAHASHPWFFYLDSDEYMSAELKEEIRRVVAEGTPAAYWVPRKYVFNDTVIERSITYPNRQMRFFHKEAVSGFHKPVHERILPRPDARVRECDHPLFVPVSLDAQSAYAKTNRYIALEIARFSPISPRTLVRVVGSGCKLVALYAFRLVRVVLFEKGPRLPLSLEMRVFHYQLRYMRRLAMAYFGLLR